jgi:flagellar hook-length control protein FliK
MEIRSPAHLASIPSAAPTAGQAASLKVGAILDVMVQARLGDNRFQLRPLPEGEPLTGISLTELSVGQRLQVQVTRLGAMPELRIIPAETPAPETVPKALRELLPKQADVKELAEMLGRLPASASPALPEPVRAAAARLAALLPQAEDLMTPDGLQKAVRNSGLFLEASLAAVLTDGTELPENDLKARLLNLLAVLQQSEAGKPAAVPKYPSRNATLPAAQGAAPQSPKPPRDETSEADMPNPEKAGQKPEGASAKMIADPLSVQAQGKGATMLPILPARNASLLSADKARNDGGAQEARDTQMLPPTPTGSFSKIAVTQPDFQPDLHKSDSARMTAVPKNLPEETVQAAAQNAAHSLAQKARDGIADPDLLDLEKLAQKAEGALAKITVDQLASQPRDDGAVSLQLNLPFIEGDYRDNVKLQIASEGGSGSDERADSSWTATIELQPPGLGAFNARIVWNGTQIDACLWSDREETRNSMSQAAEILRARLEQAGLATGALTVLDRPPLPPSAAADTQPLLDLRV